MSKQPTIESVRQELRDSIFDCAFTATAMKIESRDAEYKAAVLQAQNFAIFGANSGLMEMSEMQDWIATIYEREGSVCLGELIQKYKEQP